MSKEKSKTNTLTSSQKTTHKAKQRGAARDERSEDLKSEDHAHNISRPLQDPHNRNIR